MGRYVRLRLTAAEPDRILSRLASSGLELHEITHMDMLTVEFTIQRHNFARMDHILSHSGTAYSIRKQMGLLWHVQAVLARPVLILGVALFLFLSLHLPGRVLNVKVNGNEIVEDRRILSVAEECGITFGATKRQVRSEEVKNLLLSKMPQLQWVGVNMEGCTATIHVKERSKTDEMQNRVDYGVSGIVAGMDGIITEMTVLRGTALCKVGDSVKRGQMLISGYTDHGLCVTAEQADGEIWGYTLRKILASAPSASVVRGEYRGKHMCRSIRIGKKVIKFCNHSGIPDATCVKMYSENFWVLPGGISLPVTLIEEAYLYYDVQVPKTQMLSEPIWLQSLLEEYLHSQMIVGEILGRELNFDQAEGICRFAGRYMCRELIGQVKYEETIVENAKDN